MATSRTSCLSLALLMSTSLGCADEIAGSSDASLSVDGGAVQADAAPRVDAGLETPELGLSAGCGNANAGKGLQNRTMMVAGDERSYTRFIPNSYDPNTPLALVIALHGTAGSASLWRDRYQLEGEAQGKAIFIYPQAATDAAGETKYKAFNPNSSDFKFVDALIEQVEGSHCIDRNRVFVTGFSLGGTFAANLGCWRGDVFRAIAPVGAGGNPTVTPFTDCVGEVADWQAIGSTDDQHRGGSRLIRNYYRDINGCTGEELPTTPNGCVSYAECRADVPVHWCTYSGGHAWPAMATKGVWQFFDSFE